jgi:hypothetical protein
VDTKVGREQHDEAADADDQEAHRVGVEDGAQWCAVSDKNATAHVEARQQILGEDVGQDDGRERPDQQQPKHNTLHTPFG